MSVIAVAGGTGSLGHAVVDALNATGHFTVFILGRQVNRSFISTKVATDLIKSSVHP
jgi:nucleoside-diphosphate-sugar epimerase